MAKKIGGVTSSDRLGFSGSCLARDAEDAVMSKRSSRNGLQASRLNLERTVRRMTRPKLRCSSFRKPRRRNGFSASTDRRHLSNNTTRPARSASNRRTIRTSTITSRSCHSSPTAPQRHQCVPDPIFAEHRSLLLARLSDGRLIGRLTRQVAASIKARRSNRMMRNASPSFVASAPAW